jgi:molybdenum cofactor cytidylyltransferase
MDSRIEVVMLAAGWSRRMGGVDKRLLTVGGQALVRRSAELFVGLGLPLVVVGRAQDDALAEALAGLDLRLVSNRDAQGEQGTSARVGLAACGLAGDGVMIALADQPLLSRDDVGWLIEAFARDGARRIAIPRHDGARGNPVILPADLARALHGAPAEMAPRRFMDRHAEQILWCDTASRGFTTDLDTPEDAARLLG